MSNNPRRPRRCLAHEGGATAAEFAMTLPLLVIMLMGAFEFGWTQHCLSATRFALESTARDLLLDPDLTQAQVQTRVRDRLTGKADPNVNVTLQVTNTPAGKIAALTGTYVRNIEVPMLPAYPLTYNVRVETALPS